MKRIICCIAAAAVISGGCLIGGCKVGEAHVEYALSDDGTHYIVSGVSGDKRGLKSVVIPASYSAQEGGERLPVTEIGNNAFFECNKLMEVTLPDTIERIGVCAFAACPFEEITIPDSVKVIAEGAFYWCENLREIVIPESVEKIGGRAFRNCSALETAVINANITNLEYETFAKNVTVSAGNVYVLTSLKTVYLPASLEKIEAHALYGNFISDIYFAGTDGQWDSVYFYETVKKEGTEDEYEEKKYEKEEVLGSITVHTGVVYGQ